MPDDKILHPTDAPDASASRVAPPLRDAEANRQIGEGRPPQVTDEVRDVDAPSTDRGDGTPNIGAARAPVSAEDIDDRPDKSLYDRLADKDVTPADEGGSL